VVPDSSTGSSIATGVMVPVRPTLISRPVTGVIAWLAGNLKAIAQRGNLDVEPSARRWWNESTFTTTPSVS